MKNRCTYSLFLIIGLAGFLSSCTPVDPPLLKPVLSTNVVTRITVSTAVSGGDVSSDGGAVVTARGVCWNTSSNPTIDDSMTVDGSGSGPFTSTLPRLSPGTTYYVRAYATNKSGTAYGNECSFTTLSGIISLTTTEATYIKMTSAFSGGVIQADGGSNVTARGICWSTTVNPTISLATKTTNGSGTGSFSSMLTGLTPGTTYYVRSYATNSVGTAYGSNVLIKTLDATGTVTDIDGNEYHYITIGTQTWMVENLKTTKYRDGTSIPNVTDSTQWLALNSGAYCNYKNSAANATTYGRLYNWYAVTNKANIAPAGWHVPSDVEWGTLFNYLGGTSIAGSKLKEVGTVHWFSPNAFATNESGFTALPGGSRNLLGGFQNMGYNGYWWSTTEYSSNEAWRELMYSSYSDVTLYFHAKTNGFSVRCLRD